MTRARSEHLQRIERGLNEQRKQPDRIYKYIDNHLSRNEKQSEEITIAVIKAFTAQMELAGVA